MASQENKADLASFLCRELLAQAPPDKEIVVAGGFTDKRQIQLSKATNNRSHLNATHEEADTRMVLQCIHNNSETIVVSARDTDVLLLLVAHCDHVQYNNL